MIKKIELKDRCTVSIENDEEKQETSMWVGDYLLFFNTREQVTKHIDLLTKALELWEYDKAEEEE